MLVSPNPPFLGASWLATPAGTRLGTEKHLQGGVPWSSYPFMERQAWQADDFSREKWEA